MDISKLIDNLAEKGLDNRLPHPLSQAAFWITITLLLLAGVASFEGLRYDIQLKINSWPFLLESLSIFAIGVSASIVSFYYARPDGVPFSKLGALPFVFLVVWLGIIIFTPANTFSPDSFKNVFNPMAAFCTCHIVMVTAIPLFILFYFLRMGASVKQRWAGSMAVLGTTSFAYLFMRFIEPTDDILHLMVWHALPVVLMCLLAIGLSKFILKW